MLLNFLGFVIALIVFYLLFRFETDRIATYSFHMDRKVAFHSLSNDCFSEGLLLTVELAFAAVRWTERSMFERIQTVSTLCLSYCL